MPFPRRLASLCLALAVLGAIATPAAADSDTHKLKKAKAQAASLDAQAKRQAAQVALARTRLAALDAQANAALEGLQRASHAAQLATQAQVAAEQVLEAAQATTTRARTALNTVAANAYRSQSAGGPIAAALALVKSGDPATLMEGMNLLDEVGKTQVQALDELKVAETIQKGAEETAAQASASAHQAENGARVAKQQADELVAQQAGAVHALDQLLSATKQAAHAAHQRATSLERAIAAA